MAIKRIENRMSGKTVRDALNDNFNALDVSTRGLRDESRMTYERCMGQAAAAVQCLDTVKEQLNKLKNTSDVDAALEAQVAVNTGEIAGIEMRLGEVEYDAAQALAQVNGGSYPHYVSMKESATAVKKSWRIYGTSTAGQSGNLLGGDPSTRLYVFSLNGGEKVRMTGMMSTPRNPSMCWAVYSQYVTPSTSDETAMTLRGALIADASDKSSATGRTDVYATVNMPTNARMLIVSVDNSDDEDSKIGYETVTDDVGLADKVQDNRDDIDEMQPEVDKIVDIEAEIENIKLDLSHDMKTLVSTKRLAKGTIVYGRVQYNGVITNGRSQGVKTYLFRLDQFETKKFYGSGLGNQANNKSLCWAVWNVPDSAIDWSTLDAQPYMLDWSSYLMTEYSDPVSTEGRSGVSCGLLDLSSATGATYVSFSCVTSDDDDMEIANYSKGAVSELQHDIENIQGITNNVSATMPILKNILGSTETWNARTSGSSGNTDGLMTVHGDHCNVTMTTHGANNAGVERAVWFGFESHGMVEGHKYKVVVRYNCKVGKPYMYFYHPKYKFVNSNVVQTRLEDASDHNVWKTSLTVFEFTAQDSGDLWLDYIVRVNDATTGECVSCDIDLIPMVIDVTGCPLTGDELVSVIDNAGVFYDTLMVANYAVCSAKASVEQTMIAFGDSTTGMMMWQDKLSRMKGWRWDFESNSGKKLTDGTGYPLTAMGIGSTCVEPIIFGPSYSASGYSQYVRARYIKYYEPTVIVVMSSYNGCHAGKHWGDNSSYPIQPSDYGLQALKDSGYNYQTGTYRGIYTGGEVDLTKNSNQSVPSFAASFFGMIYYIIKDNPKATVVLVTLMSDFLGSDRSSMELKNEVIRHAADVYCLPLVDAQHCGINKVNADVTRYEGGVHFNEAGGMLLARYIASRI